MKEGDLVLILAHHFNNYIRSFASHHERQIAAVRSIDCARNSMTGDQSRTLRVGDRVCWQNDRADQGTIAEKNWAGVTIKWDNRSKQAIHHNDMAQVEQVPNKVV